MTIIINSSQGISAYRFQNEKFKIIYDKLLTSDNRIRYLSCQYVVISKNASILNVLDNSNNLYVFSNDNYDLIEKMNINDEFTSYNSNTLLEDEIVHNVFEEHKFKSHDQIMEKAELDKNKD
jgi:hypothetical protein